MALISCPVCAKDVSSDASTCPNCGHPIAKRLTEKVSERIIVQNRTPLIASALLVLLLLIGFFGLVAAVTKPNESDLRNALLQKYGLVYGLGSVAEKLGLMNVRYHDYLVFSTLSVQLPGDTERNLAFGFLGKTVIPDVPLSFNGNRMTESRPPEPVRDETVTQPVVNDPTPYVLPPAARSNPPARIDPVNTMTPEPVYSEAQMRQGLQNARQVLLSNEMRQKATDTFSGRHPFSRIEQCGEPNIQSFNQSVFGEELIAVYSCRMRGTITGENTFLVTVRVHGAITFQNGTFIRRVVDSDVIGDQRGN